MDRQKGSVLVLVVVLTVLVGGLTAALLTTTHAFHRSSSDAIEQEFAIRAAESGVAYYVGQLAGDVDYFYGNPAPHKPRRIGRGTFELESARPGLGDNQWDLVVTGTHGQIRYRMGAVVGFRQVRFPVGLLVTGSDDPEQVTLNLAGGSTIGSYDPTLGPFDVNDPRDNTTVIVNGSVDLGGHSEIYGSAIMTGTVETGGTGALQGPLTEGAPKAYADNIDSIVTDVVSSSAAANDNAVLAKIFGHQWSPAGGGENSGDLIIKKGNYVIPAGTYRVRRFEVAEGASVTFDTSGGPARLICTGTENVKNPDNLIKIDDGSSVRVDPGGTSNGLLTVLGQACDFRVIGNSTYGQAVGDPNSAGYSQIISLAQERTRALINVGGNSSVYGLLYAPSHRLFIHGNSAWYGSAVVKMLSIVASESGPAAFAVDEGTAGSLLRDPTSFEVLARWRMPLEDVVSVASGG